MSISSSEIRVVEASAGSGKTYALAKRYIQLLLRLAKEGDTLAMRRILAITFTNKAAFEMKNRILSFLKSIIFQTQTQEDFENIVAPLGLSKDKASELSYELMQNIIRHYNYFQVQTIDSFVNALLSGCAFKINLSANFRIKTNAREYLQHSLDELLDQALKDKETFKIFERFLHNYLYLENRSGWFPKEDMLGIIYSLFELYNCYGIPFKKSPLEPSDLIKIKKSILEDMKHLFSQLPPETHKTFYGSLQKFLENNLESFDLDNLSKYFCREEVPLTGKAKEGPLANDLNKIWKRICGQLTSVSQGEVISTFDPYVAVFEGVLENFYRISRKEDILVLGELNNRAGGLFDRDYITVEELYYRLATRFRHYLIDEFQDTSRLQWKNLEKMAEEALSTGGSLFYVGDKKQAIYSFRGGDVHLFDDIKRRFHSFKPQTELLTQNRRSQKAIVEFNNRIFSEDNLKQFVRQVEESDAKSSNGIDIRFDETDWQEIQTIFASAIQTFDEKRQGGYVSVEFIDGKKKEESDGTIRERLVGLIKDLQKRFSLSQIAVLTRNNQQIEDMTGWLMEEGFLVDSERTTNIKENVLIEEIIDFLRFLHSPIDHLSFAKFICGDIFAKASGVSKTQMHSFIFSLRKEIEGYKDLSIYREFRKHFPQLWDALIDDFFKNVGLYPLYELTVSIYNRLQCLANFKEYQGFFMHLLELIKKVEEQHTDLASFLEYYDELEGSELYVTMAPREAIKILTIHKAKGLEFPVVILPCLGMDVEVGSKIKDQQQSFVAHQTEEGIALLNLKKKYLPFSGEAKRLHHAEYKRSFLNELNGLYVALTRAQDEMYIFLPAKISGKNNLVQYFIPGQEQKSYGRQGTYQHLKENGNPSIALPPLEYHDWIEFLGDEFQEYDVLARRSIVEKGDIQHYLLSFINDCASIDQDALKRELSGLFEVRFPNQNNFEHHWKGLYQLINQKSLRHIFFPQKAQVLTETEIVNTFGDTKRIDRLILGEEEVLIVDYKSTVFDEDKHVEQVKEYVSIMKTIYPKKQVRGAIVYLDSFSLKEVG